MKVLLINPYIYDFTAFDLWLRPLGLMYIASVLEKYTDSELYWIDTLDRFQEGAYTENESLKKHNHKNSSGKYHRELVDRPEIFKSTPRNYCRYGIPLESLHKKLENIPPVDLIFMTSLMTYWIDGVTFTIDILKQKFPCAKIVLGGILPGLVREERLKELIPADYFIRGYGEQRALEIIREYGGTVYPHPDFSDINEIPFPAVKYLSNRDFAPLLTSRGCPMHCTYCASALLNPRFIERDPQSVYNEIRFNHDTYRTGNFVIFDDALLINKQKRFLKLFREIRENLDLHFYTPNGLHTREIDKETAQLMFDSGFKMLRLSFESTDPSILSRSSDKVSTNQMIAAVENLEVAGYNRKDIDVYLLFGIPGQNLGHLLDVLEFVKSLGVNPHLSIYSPVPGTQDFIRLQESGIVSDPVDLYETNKIYFLYNKTGFTYEEIKNIKDRFTAYSSGLK